MLELASAVAQKFNGVGVISARSIKPLCEKCLLEIKDSPIIVLEENSRIGGLGSLINNFHLTVSPIHDVSYFERH